MTWRAWVKRQFTHFYGACRATDCDRPRQRWSDYCALCFWERLEAAAEEQARREFERDVRVHTEALRRVYRARGGE